MKQRGKKSNRSLLGEGYPVLKEERVTCTGSRSRQLGEDEVLRVLEGLEEDVKPKHWESGAVAQSMDDKPWRNEESRGLEEGLPRLKEENLEKAARS